MEETVADKLPRNLEEREMTTVWPTIGAYALGRVVGQLGAIPIGVGPLTVGNLMALLTIPISLTIYGWQLMPFVCRRYKLTDRQILIQRGLANLQTEEVIILDEFDSIEIDVQPGQAWLHSGDLIFKHQDKPVLRLRSVLRPEIFRHTCLTARETLVRFDEIIQQQAAATEAETVSPTS